MSRWVFAELSMVAGYRLLNGQSPDDPHPQSALKVKQLVQTPHQQPIFLCVAIKYYAANCIIKHHRE